MCKLDPYNSNLKDDYKISEKLIDNAKRFEVEEVVKITNYYRVHEIKQLIKLKRREITK